MIKKHLTFYHRKSRKRARGHFESLAKIGRCLKKIPPPPSLSSLDKANQAITPKTTQIQDVSVKLPKLELSNFHRDIINWQRFWDQFLIAIHENDFLTDIYKFTYLRSFLSDSGLQSINGLSLNATNYKQLQFYMNGTGTSSC